MHDASHGEFGNALLGRIVRWAEGDDRVAAVLLTSSRASAVATVDALSDFDVALVVETPEAFARDLAWQDEFGRVLVRQNPEPEPGSAARFLLTHYAGGNLGATKVDFAVMPAAEIVAHADRGTLPANLDVGYRILYDPEGVAARLNPSTYTAHIPDPPTAEAFGAVVEAFFFEATYVAKNLWRAEAWPAKHSLDAVMKQQMLRRMLEWYVETERGWTYRPGRFGRGLREVLPDPLWAELEATFVGFDLDANWRALFTTLEVFRTAATTVAARLGHAYPAQVDDDVTAYLRNVRELDVP